MTALLVLALLASPPVGRQRARPSAAAGTEARPQMSDEEVRQDATAFLNTIDRPISAEQWKALGPRAADVLEPIIRDPNQFPTRRAKALAGLAAAAPARAAALAGKMARDEEQPVIVRIAAVHAAGKVLSNAAAKSELKPVLRGRDPGVRGAAAEALSEKGACDAVRDQVVQESAHRPASWKRALARCGE